MQRTLLVALVATTLACAPAPSSPAKSPSSGEHPRFTSAADVEAWKKVHSRTGAWGANDERGAANLLTAEKRRAAASLVREGVSVSIARPLETKVAPDVPSPLGHDMLENGESPKSTYSADRLTLGFHGWSHTHVDALCHIFDHGKMYNGFPQNRVTASEGCQVLGVDRIRDGLFTRGVLVDVPAFRGTSWLEPGSPVTADELTAWEARTGTKVGAGDAVIVRTGRWARRASVGPWDVSQNSPGLHASAAEWLRERNVAVVATDVGLDVIPSGVAGDILPVHVMLINTLGVYVIDDCDPEALAKELARRGRSDFLFVVAPLVIEGGTGSPINPLAVL
ncbi:Cyclase family protein [Labilithrix luteola]|uniref:Cyclase family protein n=1 Tax=Labilithrix luteola TaxID=1391654 RepID=A0A0K1PYJ0_9BACT|nr:cyclase family protein [Labilithrix luteola]AKU98600.1 Cyclase family protein [Labilithrix luteola]